MRSLNDRPLWRKLLLILVIAIALFTALGIAKADEPKAAPKVPCGIRG